MTSSNGQVGSPHHVRQRRRVLAVGGEALHAALRRVLPEWEAVAAESPLDAVWLAGKQNFDAAVVELRSGPRPLEPLAALRQAAGSLKVIVTCHAVDEPLGRQALEHGAAEYLIEPLRDADLRRALGVAAGAPAAGAWEPPPAAEPTAEEITRLSEVLRNIHDGPLATLDRLATLLLETFEAQGVQVEIDDLACGVGDASEPVLEETIYRLGRPIGRLALGRRKQGTYAANTALRLAQYARLIEAVVMQARERQRWQRLAWSDDLSGLYNRRYFEAALDRLIKRAEQGRLRITVLLFDIDDFKSYNDRHGHDTGDKLIQEVAQLLRRCTRETDVVARYGGDEFVVVFWDAEEPRVPGSQHPQEPIALAERFCKAIAEHDFECLGAAAPGPVTISGGLACYPWNGSTRQELIASADQALLEAKRTGKNRILLAGRPETAEGRAGPA